MSSDICGNEEWKGKNACGRSNVGDEDSVEYRKEIDLLGANKTVKLFL